MQALKFVGTIVLVGLIIGTGYGLWLYNQPHRDIGSERVDYQLSATKLFQQFSKNEKKANQQYLEKVVQTQGTVKEINKSEKGSISFVLEAEGADMGGVNARFTEDTADEAKAISEGDNVTIKCRCIGYESDLFNEVQLDNCSLVK